MPGDTDSPSGLTLSSFLRRLVGASAEETEAVVGRPQAREIVRLVGLEMGEEIERAVAPAVLDDPSGPWSEEDLAKVLVELKRRIDGGFTVELVEPGRIQLVNSRCPFAGDVEGRPSLCMMTSSVFGGIASRHFGYARVDVDEAIARGDGQCRVTVHLQRPDGPKPHPWSEAYHGPD